MGALFITLCKMTTFISDRGVWSFRFFRICLHKETCLMWLRWLHQIVLKRALFERRTEILWVWSLNSLLFLILIVGFLLWLFMADNLGLNLFICLISFGCLLLDKLRGMHFLIFILILLLRYDLAVFIMVFMGNIVYSGLLDLLLLRGNGESVAFELSFIDLDFFLLLLIFHALSKRRYFLLVLLINIVLMLIINFNRSLFWKLLEIVWWILFVELSLLK